MFALLQLDLLAERTAQNQRVRAFQTRCAFHGERLEIAAVRPGRLQSGLLEMVGDKVGREIDSFGCDAPALTFVRGEEGDVLPHPLLDRLIRRWSLVAQEEQQRYDRQHLPPTPPMPPSHCVPLASEPRIQKVCLSCYILNDRARSCDTSPRHEQGRLLVPRAGVLPNPAR